MASTASSSSSSSPSSIALVYPSSTSFLSEKPCHPFTVITPASTLQQQQNLNKRKRDLLDSGTGTGQARGQMNQFRVVVRQPLVAPTPGSSFGPTGKLKAKPPKAYSTSEELLAALSKTCVEDPEVDFSGSYIVSAPDADMLSDKARVQTVTNDIWKATGYRFTVKDHPPTERGHKTRLWCSQDEARRSKHRGNNDAPRLSKQGELFAKQRFPCRSRLMITCLPAPEGTRAAPGRIVTIRMHHYVRHEAYLEAAAEPNTSSGGIEAPGPPPTLMPQTAQFLSAITAPLPPALVGMSMGARGDIELPRAVPVAPPPPLHEQEGEWDNVPPSPSPSPCFAPPLPQIDPRLEGLVHRPPQLPLSQPQSHSQQHIPTQHPHSHPPPPSRPPPPPSHPPPSQHPSLPSPPPQQQQQHPHPHPHPPPAQQHPHPHPPPPQQLTPDEFQHRMRTHIARIRDFCDGLEYQVQFNDYRMLEALERDAAPFIGFLEDCLRREGRLA
ncbi:hypothetical protein B0H12DRAFT_1155644 [Mycena haematopus]|nr:hypothetical protein B0H12DRAFT_1155644 [Mycena haematopus]